MKWFWEWFKIWTPIYIINLPMLVFFGFCASIDFGRVGIVVGIVLLWFFGLALCHVPKRIRISLCVGGGIVAMFQLLPILQLYCGFIAIKSLKVAAGNSYYYASVDTFFNGFALTLITGQLLAFSSLIIGYLVTGFLWRFKLMDPMDETLSPKQAGLKDPDDQSPGLPSPPDS